MNHPINSVKPATSSIDGSGFLLSVFTSSKPQILTKSYSLEGDRLIKKSVANMYEGGVHRVSCDNLQDFADTLETLNPNQALAYGVTEAERASIRTANHDDVKNGKAIARTTKHFEYQQGRGVMMFDYDPAPDSKVLSKDELVNILCDVIPDFDKVGYVHWCSSSSHIYKDDTDLTGLKGQRLYVAVDDASDIPRAGDALQLKLWQAGYGYIMVSRAGSMLERTTFDASVYQSNRLDFAAGAYCNDGLKQKRGKPFVHDGVSLDTLTAIPCPDDEGYLITEQAKQAAKNAIKPEADNKRIEWIDTTAKKHAASASDADIQTAKDNLVKSLNNNVLMGDFVVSLKIDNQIVELTIGELLDNPVKYHRAQCLDPLEPEYNNHHVCGIVYLIGSRATLYSQAHGGKSFKLLRQPRAIELIKGGLTEAVLQTIEVMKSSSSLYNWYESIATIQDGKPHLLNESSLLMWLGQHITYFINKKTEGGVIQVQQDAPIRLVKTVLATAAHELPVLKAIRTTQCIRLDGSIINKAGYDARTQIYIDSLDALPAINPNPTMDDVQAAVQRIMKPYNDFDYISPLDRAVKFAATMTAAIGQILPTRPAFAYDAPTKGSGKTLLAKCDSAVASSGNALIMPHTSSAKGGDEETRKRIFSALHIGAPVVVWDNILGMFDSAALASVLTAPETTDRLLGKSEVVTIANTTMIVLTGNNLVLAGELPRRVLKCRIDPNTDRPFAREFSLDPEAYTKANRAQITADVITVIVGWFNAHKQGVPKAQGNLASFEEWDKFVRQPVAWLARLMPNLFDDPMNQIAANYDDDPHADSLRDLLSALHGAYLTRPFTASNVYERIRADGYGSCLDPVLRDVLMDITHNPNPSTKTIGRLLNNRKDGKLDGKKLVAQKNSVSKVFEYRIQVDVTH